MQLDDLEEFVDHDFLKLERHLILQIFDQHFLIIKLDITNQTLKFESKDEELLELINLLQSFKCLYEIDSFVKIIEYQIQFFENFLSTKKRFDRVLFKTKE
jgi:hypothetical protein